MGDKESFKITTNKRYWEDEDFGILVKKNSSFNVYPKHLRSYLLKFAIMRGDVLLMPGEKCTFGFKSRILDIVGGEDKNLITIIQENGEKVNKKYNGKATRDIVKKTLRKEDDVIVIKEDIKDIKKEKKPKKKPKKKSSNK